jgi:CelD/BcsL family acetyltransferase involved in cellulose biosynthesis
MRVTVKPAAALTPAEAARWSEIQAADSALASPYFSPVFTVTFGSVRPGLEVAVIDHDGEITGFFPFERGRWGLGRPVAFGYSDHHGPVIEAGRAWDAGSLLSGCGLRLWHFDHLPAGLAAFAPFHERRDRSPIIDVATGPPPARELREVRRKARKLAREHGPLRFERHAGDPAVLSRLLAWKRAQYARTGVPDVLAPAWIRRALAAVLEVQQPSFAGVLSTLSAGDRLVAAHLGLRSQTVWHWWFPAYDPAFARYSPGLVLLLELVDAARAQGIRTIDLGKGDERYKSTLMTGSVPLAAGTAHADPLSGLAASLYRSGRRAAGRARRSTRAQAPASASSRRMSAVGPLKSTGCSSTRSPNGDSR